MTESTDSDLDVSPEKAPTSQNGAPNDKPNSIDEEALVTKLVQRLTPEIEKMVQSKSDRRFSQFERKFDVIQKELRDSLEADGLEQDEIDAELQKLTRRLPIAKTQTTPASDKDKGGTPTLAPAEAERAVLVALGLKEDDPDVLAFNERKITDPIERIAALTNIATNKLKPANPAAVQPSAGQSVTLKSQYDNDMKAVKQGDIDSIYRVKDKYRKLGLKVD